MSVVNASKFLGNLIFKKSVQKQTGIMKTINPMEKKLAENKAKFALEQLQKNNNIDINNLSANDFEMLAENIVNPIKNVTQTSVKSADILDFRYKRNFAEELADASKKGDFKQMTGIMKVDPKFKEVMESLKASKAADAAKAKMIGPKKLIPDRDVIPYQSPEVQKLDFADKLKRSGLTEQEYMNNIVKRGYNVDDAIYARDFYGDTTDQIIKNANTKGAPVAFAGGGVAGLLGERTGYKDGKDVFIGPKRKKKTKKELEDEKILKEKIAAYLESQTINLPEEDPLKKYQPTDYSLYGGFMDNVKMKEDRTGNIINDFNNISIDPKDARVGISRFNPKTNSSFVAGAGPSGFNINLTKQFADGGPARQNFAMGKRAFLKLLAGTGAGIAGLKTGLFGLGKKAAVKTAAPIVADAAVVPPHFLKLVAKIKSLGDDITVGSATMPRTKVTRYKDYELTESMDGSKQIQKIGKEDDMITQSEYMTYTKGQADETTKGKKVADDYEEVTETHSRIYKDNFNDPDYEDGINLKEILEEVGETVTKKADGGRANFVIGGKAAGKGIMATINKLFGKPVITTADKIKRPKKALDREMFKKADDRLNDKRQMNKDELEDFEIEIGDNIEAYDFDGTVGDAKRIIKDIKDYEAEMFAEYKSIGGSKRLGGPKDPMADAIDNASPGYTGDLKYDAQLVADDLAEKMFKVEYDDLTQAQQMDLYDKAYTALSKNQQGFKQMQNLSKPTNTLESIKNTGTIDISNPNVADEFTKFMKESNPKGFKDIEQKIQLESFDPKGRKKNATGGLAAMLGE